MTTDFFQKDILNLMRIIFLTTFLLLFKSLLYAQNSREETVKRQLNIGKQLISEGNFDSATIVLKSAFIKNAVLPDELLYYYGLSLYRKGDLDQSKKLIDKFLNISNSQTKLLPQAKDLQRSIDTAIDATLTICTRCDGEGYHLHQCTKCEGRGEEKCEVCKGKGKVLIGNASGMKYGLCTTCMGDGLRTCVKCGGKKQVSEVCDVCKGKGKVRFIGK
jgi:tetratricopeptide (TPR) repeat protein